MCADEERHAPTRASLILVELYYIHTVLSTINRSVIWFVKHQKLGVKVDQCFPKSELMSSNVSFCLKSEYNQFTVMED